MTARTLKAVALVVTVLVSMVVAAAYITAPYVGSAYLMVVNGLGDQFPPITKTVVLPLLRVGLENHLEQPFTGGWPMVVWAILFVAPWLALVLSARAGSLDAALARWVSGLLLYGAVVTGIAVIVLLGLAIPIAYIM